MLLNYQSQTWRSPPLRREAFVIAALLARPEAGGLWLKKPTSGAA